MGRRRVNYRKCTYGGCEVYPKSGRKRCSEHNFWKLQAEECDERPPKTDKGMEWCEPCHEWFDSPLHVPKPKRFTSRGELAPITFPGLLSAA